MIREALAKCFRELLKNSNKDYVDILDMKIFFTFEFGLNETSFNELIKKAEKEGLIYIENNKIYPTFDYLNVEIPHNIKITISSDEINIKDIVIERISNSTQKSKEEILKDLELLKKEFPMFMEEILLIYLAMKNNVDVKDLIDHVKNKIKFD